MTSHSEIATYLDCQKKWELTYKRGYKVDNEHVRFGRMAHKVLEKGRESIPPEEYYNSLKEFFDITSWQDYFNPVFEELEEFTKDKEIIHRELRLEDSELCGVADLIVKDGDRVIICDYKFVNSLKDTLDLRLDQQMYIYAYLYYSRTKFDIDKIDTCYLSIPKAQFVKPRLLKSGELSKDKSQYTNKQLYLEAIAENHLNISDYTDILSILESRKAVRIVRDRLDVEMFMKVMKNIDRVIEDMRKGYVLEECSSKCKKCDFLKACKGV